MTEMTERIGLVCHAREYDLLGSEHYPLYLMWLESVSLWGVESPPAMGCLLGLVRAAWGMGCAVNVHHSGSAQDWHGVRVFHAGAPAGDLFEGYGVESYAAALEAA